MLASCAEEGHYIEIILRPFISPEAGYAKPQYSEESKRLAREAGLQVDELEWEEIDKRQQEYRRRKELSMSSNDELHIRNNGTTGGSVTVTDTADELHIYSNEYASQGQNYGSKNSYDEFHTASVDIAPNDGHKSGGFDELHINENYRQNVWHPEHRGNRIQGFDEFRYPDEM
ncbi:MAG: hypothetical protein IJT96_03500 [Lachnospiraceae bacterium]|nr:hypothetical protein [Lachnospiraceae bacterium]